MTTEIKNKIAVKIFVGCLITSELRMHLKQSKTWKQASIDRTALIETDFQNKQFLGRFLTDDLITLDEWRQIEKEIKQQLRDYCPEIGVEALAVHTFPQVFIT